MPLMVRIAPHHAAPARRRHAAPQHPAAPAAAPADQLGYAEVELPAGSRRIGPVQVGDQGISANERPHAEQAIKRLFEAGGIDMVALYDSDANTYELRSRTGFIRWERWATPTGELRYRIVARGGENPVPNVDGTLLRTFAEETDAAGGAGRPVPKDKNAYPDLFARLSQLFDNARAPEFVMIPTSGGDPNHPGAGSHGVPDMVQSRAPLVIAGPGIAHGVTTEQLFRHEDLAPTLAELLGVRPVVGTNASGVPRTQLLKWQDGRSQAGGLVDAHAGAAYGSAQRAVVFTIDGLSQTVFQDELEHGHLPNLARIVAAGTRYANGSLAEYPTVTWANHNTLMTGAGPGHNGLVNNSWWDRSTQTEQLITDGGAKNVLRTGRLMEPQVETIYEAVERSFPGAMTMAVNQPSGRGADVSVLDLHGLPTLLANLPRLGLAWLKNRALKDVDGELHGGEWKGEAIKDAFAAAIGDVFWTKKTPPKLGVFEFTLVDNRGHWMGPHTDDARRSLQAVDRQIGTVLDAIESRGIAGSTAIVLTADHGMEHQDTDPAKVGGWKEALQRAAADGAVTKESTRFVYVRSMRWKVDGDVPAVGTSGSLALTVTNDDIDGTGVRPAMAGATVTVRDADGHEWHGTSDADGHVRIDGVAPTAGPMQVTIEHADFSREEGTIDVPGANPPAGDPPRVRSRRRR
jgi:hypothetical protein